MAADLYWKPVVWMDALAHITLAYRLFLSIDSNKYRKNFKLTE